MDTASIKDKLSRVKMCDLEIESITEELAWLHKTILPLLAKWYNPKVQDILNTVARLEYQRQTEIQAIQDRKQQVEALIEKVENETQREILVLRYLKMEKWETITDKMNYSLRQTMKLHKQALTTIAEILSREQ